VAHGCQKPRAASKPTGGFIQHTLSAEEYVPASAGSSNPRDVSSFRDLNRAVCHPANFQRASGSPTLRRQRCGQRERTMLSRAPLGCLQSGVMLGFHRHTIGQLVQTTSELRARIQRLERRTSDFAIATRRGTPASYFDGAYRRRRSGGICHRSCDRAIRRSNACASTTSASRSCGWPRPNAHRVAVSRRHFHA
jgi:hypothetical protein